MGHTITLDDRSKLLDKETLQDFIDLFFDARDSEFLIEVVPVSGKVPNGNIRGLMMASSLGRFKITLYAGNIKVHMDRGIALGGNVTKTSELKLGVYLVLAHELRHAYQAVYFGHNTTLQKGRYKARAGEIDARRHVDENYDSICAFLGLDATPISSAPPSSDADLLVDLLEEQSVDGVIKKSEDDLWDEVMSMSGDPEVTFRRVQAGIQSRGLRLG
jgi:hypothetical protein